MTLPMDDVNVLEQVFYYLKQCPGEERERLITTARSLYSETQSPIIKDSLEGMIETLNAEE